MGATSITGWREVLDLAARLLVWDPHALGLSDRFATGPLICYLSTMDSRDRWQANTLMGCMLFWTSARRGGLLLHCGSLRHATTVGQHLQLCVALTQKVPCKYHSAGRSNPDSQHVRTCPRPPLPPLRPPLPLLPLSPLLMIVAAAVSMSTPR